MRRRTRRKVRKIKMLLSLAVAVLIVASQLVSGEFKPSDPLLVQTGKAQSISAQNSIITCTKPHVVDGDTLTVTGRASGSTALIPQKCRDIADKGVNVCRVILLPLKTI